MAEPWIRVHANLISKPVVRRAVDELRVKKAEAVGLLVTFWGSVSQHATDGLVGRFSDGQLEDWACWTGRRGRFAEFLRTHHIDSEGRVNEWEDYAGKLEQRRATERERLRNKRRGVAQHPANGRSVLAPARTDEDETKRDETKTTTAPPPPAESAIASRLTNDADRNALTAVVRIAPNATAWLAEMAAALDGMAGHAHLSPLQLGEALRDFVGNGATSTPGLKHFRAYLRRAAVEKPGRERDDDGYQRTQNALDEMIAREKAKEAANA